MNILKIIFGTLAISLISINSFCQEKYLGTWKGELTQDPDSKYYFEINIDGKNEISDYNQIQIDLLNAYKFYPGEYYISKHSNYSLITNKIPNNTTLQGLKRYAERIFIKTNKNF